MSDVDLPFEWLATQLECIADVVTGKTPSKKNPEYFGGSIPFIKPGDVNDQGNISYTDEYITELGALTVPTIPKGSVVVTCIGNLGRCAITSERSSTNQQINSVLPNSKVDVKFIYYQLRTLKQWMLLESSATTVTIINKSKFSQAPIILSPLAEQKIIADKLDILLAQVDSTKSRLERIPQILKTFRQSVLAAAVSGKLTEEWRGQSNYCEISLNLEKSYKSISVPNNWLISRLCDSCKVVSGNAFKSGDFLNEGHVPVIKISNVQYGKFEIKNQQFLPSEYIETYHDFAVCDGDLLMALTRPITNDTLKVCRYPASQPVGLLNQRVAKFVFRNNSEKAFFELLFQSDYFKVQVIDKLSETLQPNLSPVDLKNFIVAIPDESEQTEIVRRVETLFAFADSIEQKANAALARVNNLTQSILAKAFRGELTADWRAANPDLITGENSAAALLEKIKAEREAMQPKKKTKTKA